MDNVAELIKLKLHILDGFDNWDRRDYRYDEYIATLNRINKELGDRKCKPAWFTLVKRSHDELPKHNGFYLRNKYCDTEFKEFKDGDWVGDKGYQGMDKIWHTYPPEDWFEIVEIKE